MIEHNLIGILGRGNFVKSAQVGHASKTMISSSSRQPLFLPMCRCALANTAAAHNKLSAIRNREIATSAYRSEKI